MVVANLLLVALLLVCSSMAWEQVVVVVVVWLLLLPMVEAQMTALDQMVVAGHDWCSVLEEVGWDLGEIVGVVYSVPLEVVVVVLVAS